MSDVPRRFKILSSHPIMVDLGLRDTYGVYFPDFGTYIIVSEERGIDDLTGCPEDVEWLDGPEIKYKIFGAFSDTCWRQHLKAGEFDDLDLAIEACKASSKDSLFDDVDYVVSTHRDGEEWYRVKANQLERWKTIKCECGHSKFDHEDEHDEVPTGTGHCMWSGCGCSSFKGEATPSYQGKQNEPQNDEKAK